MKRHPEIAERYEFKIVDLGLDFDDKYIAALNKLGRDGWRIIAPTPRPGRVLMERALREGK
jgi:hypothetical protein